MSKTTRTVRNPQTPQCETVLQTSVTKKVVKASFFPGFLTIATGQCPRKRTVHLSSNIVLSHAQVAWETTNRLVVAQVCTF